MGYYRQYREQNTRRVHTGAEDATALHSWLSTKKSRQKIKNQLENQLHEFLV